jgi:hypothetical protein
MPLKRDPRKRNGSVSCETVTYSIESLFLERDSRKRDSRKRLDPLLTLCSRCRDGRL